MNFDEYQFKLNVKAMCLYEKLSGKSFFNMGDSEEESMMLIYAIIQVNNNLDFTYDVFKGMMENISFAKWVKRRTLSLTKYLAQFKAPDINHDNHDNGENEDNTMTRIASALIVRYGLDPHYVMYEMEQWEIESYINAYDEKTKERMEVERLWTYLQILPHVDGKKLKGPDALIKFPWEGDDRKKKAMKDIENKQEMIKRALSSMNKEKQ